MPEICVHGETKKVACGPCIRGHRSSKCHHTDRVLVEVRKPGRPLSACPHPTGACGCERAVVYAIPRDFQTPYLIPAGTLLPIKPVAALNAKIQKQPKAKVGKGSTITPAKVQLSLDKLDSAALVKPVPVLTQNASGSSSNAPSLGSSSNSTPQLSAIDGGPLQRNDSSRPSFDIKDEEQLGLSGDIMGGGGQSSWVGNENISGRSGSKPTSSEPAKAQPRSGCCGPKAPQENDKAGQAQQDALQNMLDHVNSTAPNGGPLDYGADMDGSNSQLHSPFHTALNVPPFSEYENRFGCSTNGQISRHLDRGGEQHDCSCGDGCICFACLQHPANNTMIEYAQFHNQYGSYDPNTHRNGLHLQPQFPQPSHPGNPYMNNMTMIPGPVPNLQQYQFSSPVHSWDGASQQYAMSQGTLQQMMSTPASTVHPYCYQSHLRPLTLALNNNTTQASQRPAYQRRSGAQAQTSDTDPTLMASSILDTEQVISQDSPSTDQEDNVSVLSTSGFQIQHFRVPGCSDVTGTCRCGDGCICSNCVDHGGHPGDQDIVKGINADAISTDVHAMNTISNPSDLGDDFTLDEYLTNFQHQHPMTPASVPDDFHGHLQFPITTAEW